MKGTTNLFTRIKKNNTENKKNVMTTQPMNYNREGFIGFLKKSNESSDIIERFMNLPEKIIYKEHEYELNIRLTFYSGEGSYYSFELNYYADDILEFLLSYKVFQNIEQSIDRAECELLQRGYISEVYSYNC